MSVAVLVHHLRPRLVGAVQSRFPLLCAARAEDAVSDTVLDAVRRPAGFQAALERDGHTGLWRFASCIARRHARAQTRRRAWRREEGTAVGDPVGVVLPAQEFLAAAPHELGELLGAVATEVSPGSAVPLARALRDKLEEGATDGEVAARHGVRREYVNRAWLRVRARVWGQ